jgi:hypothetical protein
VTSGKFRKEVKIDASGSAVVPLDANATEASIEVSGPAVIARFERPALRRWSHPPDASASPLAVNVTWPSDARAGRTGTLRLDLRHRLGRPCTVDVRVPLPAGVSLAEAVTGVRQVQGALAVRRALDASALPATIEIPVRFGLAGRVTAPEVRATIVSEDAPRAIAPARALAIR